MADHIVIVPVKMERPLPAIIAVMGLPYTYRKELGPSIALWAGGPNLEFEVILDALLNENDVRAKEDDAFNVLFRTALSLLDWNRSNCVVINFPVPSNCKSQLEKLLNLCECSYKRQLVLPSKITKESYKLPLLIIECQRSNRFRWETNVENPNTAFGTNLSYYVQTWKDGEWKDVEKAILEHQQQGLDDDYFLNMSTRYPNTLVNRMVVDTFEDLKSWDFTPLQGLNGRSLFAKAIQCLLDDHNYYRYRKANGTVDYARWRRQWLEHKASCRILWRQWLEHKASSSGSSSSERSLCDPGNCILRFAKNLQAEAIICEACDDKVTEGAYYYYCLLCSLSLHESCGTSSTRGMHRYEVIERYNIADESKFPKTYACHSCEKEGKPFSVLCNACIFRTHLKGRLLPTALKHSCGQDHILSIRISSWSESLLTSAYDCKACGLKGVFSSYSCHICNLDYHLQCLLELPLHTKDVGHGGHMHNMNIQFPCGAKEDEYEWCLVCYKDINPECWVYTCQECDYVAHVYCIFPSDTFELNKQLTG